MEDAAQIRPRADINVMYFLIMLHLVDNVVDNIVVGNNLLCKKCPHVALSFAYSPRHTTVAAAGSLHQDGPYRLRHWLGWYCYLMYYFLFQGCICCEAGSLYPLKAIADPLHDLWKPYCGWFLPRCMQCRRSLAMRILSVRLSVCPSVRLSLTCVDCDKTVERSVQIYIPCERTFSLVFWEEEWLVGGDPF